MTRKFAAPAVAMMALAGCNLSRSDLKPRADQVLGGVVNTNANLNRPGRVVEPKYCKVDSAIITRPVGDRMVDASLWNVADEQSIPVDLRAILEANGLRVGIVTGALPADVLEAFKPNPPVQETLWVHLTMPEGEHSPIILGGKTASVSLLLNHKGKVDGRDYTDAGGRLIVTTSHRGPYDVSLRIVPEVHHGAERRTIAALQNGGPFAQQQFAIKDGQQEDILRELTMELDVKPGQSVVIGCRAGQARSLGTFLFTQPEPNTDRMMQSVLILQASRNNAGVPPLKPVDEADDARDLAVRPITAAFRSLKAN